MEASEAYIKFVRNFVDSCFSSHALRRVDYQPGINTTFDHYITPYNLSLEEKAVKTHIDSAPDIKGTAIIAPFPKEVLELNLVLEPPKRILNYYNPELHDKKKLGRPKGPRNVNKQAAMSTSGDRPKQGKRPAMELASIYTLDEGQQRKKSRHNSDSENSEESDEDLISGDFVGPPEHMYPVIAKLHDEFWNLEYTDTESPAFFARITSKNCHEYGLKEFADESSCLAVIKDRLFRKDYQSGDEFAIDFRSMFQNIVLFFPQTHPAYAKALELSRRFEQRWESDKLKF